MTVRFYESNLVTFAVSQLLAGANQFTEGAEFDPRQPFNLSISGSFNATVTLQRSFDDGVTWRDVWTTTAPAERLVDTIESGLLWRVGCRTGEYTSGTISIRLSQ